MIVNDKKPRNDVSIRQTSLHLSEKKVHKLGVFIIITAVVALAVALYFGATRGFEDLTVLVLGPSSLLLLALGIVLSSKKETNIKKVIREPVPETQTQSTAPKVEEVDELFLEIKDKVTSCNTIDDFIKICANFEPVEKYRGRMEKLFACIDPERTLRKKFVEEMKRRVENDFVNLFTQMQNLETKIGWSFLNLLAKGEAARHFQEHFQSHCTYQDFDLMRGYLEIAERLLPNTIWGSMTKKNFDPNKLMTNWVAFNERSSKA